MKVNSFKPARLLLIMIAVACFNAASAQQAPVLPAISVKNLNNKIIISWVNEYPTTITALNIQRSYDSLKNFSSIGSVLSPQSRENGFADANFPYNKMFYRVFVAFEGGTYVISKASRPVKDTSSSLTDLNSITEKYPWMADPAQPEVIAPVKPGIPALSTTIFAARDNNVVIHLPDYASKKYNVKFFDEADNMIFEITSLKEEYLIVEKVNFIHTGSFRFELYENGTLKETNKFQILKDSKKL